MSPQLWENEIATEKDNLPVPKPKKEQRKGFLNEAYTYRYINGKKDISFKHIADTLIKHNGNINKSRRELGLSYNTLAKLCDNEGLLMMVQTEANKLMLSVPASVDTYQSYIDEIADPDTRKRMTPEDKKLAAGFARDVLKTGGILPNDQVSIHLSQNVFNTQVNVIPPIVQELLDKHLSGLNVIDAEIEEE